VTAAYGITNHIRKLSHLYQTIGANIKIGSVRRCLCLYNRSLWVKTVLKA